MTIKLFHSLYTAILNICCYKDMMFVVNIVSRGPKRTIIFSSLCSGFHSREHGYISELGNIRHHVSCLAINHYPCLLCTLNLSTRPLALMSLISTYFLCFISKKVKYTEYININETTTLKS